MVGTSTRSNEQTRLALWNRAYIALLLLRIYFALRPGYIYPDEYDRGKQVISAGLNHLQVYAGPVVMCNGTPCYSLVPSIWSSSLPLGLVNWWTWTKATDLRPYILFVAERVSLFFFSLYLDSAVTTLIGDPESRARALVLLSSSYIMLTYQVRQYSNSIEAVMLALTLSALHVRLEQGKLPSQKMLIVQIAFFTAYFVNGTFAGPSFLAFAVPSLYHVTRWSLGYPTRFTAGQPRRAFWKRWMQFIVGPAMVGIVLISFNIFADTAFWWEKTNHRLIIIPFDWLRGALHDSSDGRAFTLWKHPLVSLLWSIGPGLLYYGFRATMEILRPTLAPVALPLDPEDIDLEEESTDRPPTRKAPGAPLVLHILLSAMVFLLIFWHQEPRVLTPLLVPLILIIAATSQIMRMGRAFWIPWILTNAVLAVAFGVLHQGGVIPSLINLHDHLGHINSTAPPDFNGALASVVYWKTYPPQWHMLALFKDDVASGRFSLTYLEDAPRNQLIGHVLATPAQESLVVAPLYALQGIAEEERKCFELRDRIFPHLDSDHLSEALTAGWKDSISLGIFSADTACLQVGSTRGMDFNVDVE